LEADRAATALPLGHWFPQHARSNSIPARGRFSGVIRLVPREYLVPFPFKGSRSSFGASCRQILLNMVCAGTRGESGWCSDQTSALGTCTHAGVQPLAKVAGGRNRTPRVLHTPWPKPRPGTSLVRSGRLVLPGVASPPPFRPAVRFSPPLLSRPCNPSRCFSLARRPAREPRLGPQFQSHGSLVV
jgi:hypothetical protein